MVEYERVTLAEILLFYNPYRNEYLIKDHERAIENMYTCNTLSTVFNTSSKKVLPRAVDSLAILIIDKRRQLDIIKRKMRKRESFLYHVLESFTPLEKYQVNQFLMKEGGYLKAEIAEKLIGGLSDRVYQHNIEKYEKRQAKRRELVTLFNEEVRQLSS
ncbi:hypothetical protein ROU88_05545 [Macrococcus capreoli]